jgi:hypothetical protein
LISLVVGAPGQQARQQLDQKVERPRSGYFIVQMYLWNQ